MHGPVLGLCARVKQEAITGWWRSWQTLHGSVCAVMTPSLIPSPSHTGIPCQSTSQEWSCIPCSVSKAPLRHDLFTSLSSLHSSTHTLFLNAEDFALHFLRAEQESDSFTSIEHCIQLLNVFAVLVICLGRIQQWCNIFLLAFVPKTPLLSIQT